MVVLVSVLFFWTVTFSPELTAAMLRSISVMNTPGSVENLPFTFTVAGPFSLEPPTM